MSRAGYSEDGENWAFIRWRGAVASAIRGRRGQAFLREVLVALDALPEKTLAAESLVADGQFCALGAVGRLRGMDLRKLDPEDHRSVAEAFGISDALAREIAYENDDGGGAAFAGSHKWVEICGPMSGCQQHHRMRWVENPRAGEVRWSAMRAWVVRHLKDDEQAR